MGEGTAKLFRELIEPLRVPPGKKVKLERDFDPAATADFVEKEEADELLAEGSRCSPSTRRASRRRTPTASSSSSRRSTAAARTAPSSTS